MMHAHASEQEETDSYKLADALQGLVNFEGYYLEGEDAHSPREPAYQTHKVDELEAEAKYTENRTIIRLASRYRIK